MSETPLGLGLGHSAEATRFNGYFRSLVDSLSIPMA